MIYVRYIYIHVYLVNQNTFDYILVNDRVKDDISDVTVRIHQIAARLEEAKATLSTTCTTDVCPTPSK